jgi:CRP/FNR family cyclic AMP-dependent transcriptional regulator
MTLSLATSTRRSFVRVLEVDPELGSGLSEEERRRATKYLLARATTLPAGDWDPVVGCPPQEPGSLGMLVVEGLLARRVDVCGASALELLGPGDIARPWDGEDEPADTARTSSWKALSTTEVAWLDHEFGLVASRWPEILPALIRCTVQRANRLACHLAISHVVGVESRILQLLAHMAERWGRVTVDGVLIPIPLTNEMLGAIIGARPPSVSTGLRKLAGGGALVRRPDGTWLLHTGAVMDQQPLAASA